jgi:hypothetical protein
MGAMPRYRAGLTGIFLANEQLGSGMDRLPAVVNAAFSDLSTYLHNSHKQLHFVVSSALDQTVEATYSDLDSEFHKKRKKKCFGSEIFMAGKKQVLLKEPASRLNADIAHVFQAKQAF